METSRSLKRPSDEDTEQQSSSKKARITLDQPSVTSRSIKSMLHSVKDLFFRSIKTSLPIRTANNAMGKDYISTNQKGIRYSHGQFLVDQSKSNSGKEMDLVGSAQSSESHWLSKPNRLTFMSRKKLMLYKKFGANKGWSTTSLDVLSGTDPKHFSPNITSNISPPSSTFFSQDVLSGTDPKHFSPNITSNISPPSSTFTSQDVLLGTDPKHFSPNITSNISPPSSTFTSQDVLLGTDPKHFSPNITSNISPPSSTFTSQDVLLGTGPRHFRPNITSNISPPSSTFTSQNVLLGTGPRHFSPNITSNISPPSSTFFSQDVLLGTGPRHFSPNITSNISPPSGSTFWPRNKSYKKTSLLNSKMEHKLNRGSYLKRSGPDVGQWFKPEDRECFAKALDQQIISIKRDQYFDAKMNLGLNEVNYPLFNHRSQGNKCTGALSKSQMSMTEVESKAKSIEAIHSIRSQVQTSKSKQNPVVIALDQGKSEIFITRYDVTSKIEEIKSVKIMEEPFLSSEEHNESLKITKNNSSTEVVNMKKETLLKFTSFEDELSRKDFFAQDYVKLLREKYDSKARKFYLDRIEKDKAIEIIRKNEAISEDQFGNAIKITDEEIKEGEGAREGELPEMTTSMKEKIHWALNFRGEILIQKFNIPIRQEDINTLSGLNWLNDEIINFYMQMIVERSKHIDNWPKVYAFSTFFYPKLMQSGHSGVRRWTRNVDIFSYDMLLIPVHLGMHWCLGVVDFRRSSVYYYDSMLGSNLGFLEAIVKYLEDEHLEKKKSSFSTSEFKTKIVKNIPKQMNGSDCGMFTCKFAEYLSRDSEITFTQENMPYYRNRMIYEICSETLLFP